MTRHAMVLTGVLIAACAASDVRAVADPVDELQFKVNPTPYRIEEPDADSPYGMPEYVVLFITDAPLDSLIPDPKPRRKLVLSAKLAHWLREDAEQLSAEQHKVWRDSRGWIAHEQLGPKRDGYQSRPDELAFTVPWDLFPSLKDWPSKRTDWRSAPTVYRFFAASEADARIIMNKILERANATARDYLASAARQLTELRQEVSETRAQLADAEARIARATARLEEMGTRLGYTDGRLANQELADVLRAMRRLEVEMAGAMAKGAAIDKLLTAEVANTALVGMRTELDVEMAGLLGRMETLREQCAELKTYAGVPDELDAARRARNAARETLESRKFTHTPALAEQPAELEELLEDPPDYMRPVELIDNTVVLRPVKVVHVETP